MNPAIAKLIGALWIGWLAYWYANARDVKTTRWREPFASQLLYRIPVMISAILLMAPDRLPAVLLRRFAPPSVWLYAVAVAATVSGLGFSIWARRHLGRNWSAIVTVKEGHSLIRTGPYRYVRHPIYTGILLAFAGTALATGQWRGPLAVVIALASFGLKTSVEERRMRETFPEYEEYRRETARLVPFVF